MPVIPFAHQWTIAENELLPLKDSVDDGYLSSTSALNIPAFEYYLKIFPNGHQNGHLGKTRIGLILKFKNVKKVEADYTLTIESVNYSKIGHSVYEKSEGFGISICSTEEFFDPQKKFIVNGKFTVKVDGIFKFERIDGAIPAVIQEQQKWIGGKLGDELWMKNGTKDFKIITSDGKEINVHRFVLANRSEVFNTTFNLKNESIKRKKAEISDFSFKVVETGVKLIYECNFTSNLSLGESMHLVQFLDKFGFPALKAQVEPYLINQISASTVCRLTNCSVKTNSSKLKEKCMEFLMDSFASKTALTEIKTLNKDIAIEILENSQRQTSETKITTSEIAETEHKWTCGDLGDKLWNDHETKDFTIFVDGEEIKAHKNILGVQSKMFKEISNKANENEAEIFNFSPKVVEIGIKFIYECNFTTKLSNNEFMQLQHFFDKYHLSELKAKVEPILISQISASTVCRLTNCSILTNSSKLKEKCIEFLMDAFESKTALADIDELDKDVALQILENSLYQHLETKK